MTSFTRQAFAVPAFSLMTFFSIAQDIPPNYLSVPGKTFTIPFIWNADSINGKWDENAALLIPVKLDNCPRQFYMQFDLGSPYSVFYTNKLTAINVRYKRVASVSDTAKKLTAFSFDLSGVKIKASEITLRKVGAEAISLDDQGIEIIGTLGTDLLDNRQVLIDYPGKSITVNFHSTDSLPVTDIYYSGRRILFPAIVAGKKTILYFDTGSSAFELLTNKETAQTLAAADAKPVKYKVNSWGKMLDATTLPVTSMIEIGNVKLPLKNATYIEGASETQIQQMMKMGIGGMTGNKLFLHSVLFLDLKKKKFSILPGRE